MLSSPLLCWLTASFKFSKLFGPFLAEELASGTFFCKKRSADAMQSVNALQGYAPKFLEIYA